MAKIGKRWAIKDGKIVPTEAGLSVSARIRQNKSKRTKCVSRAKAALARAQRP
jgi:hypothetical protein